MKFLFPLLALGLVAASKRPSSSATPAAEPASPGQQKTLPPGDAQQGSEPRGTALERGPTVITRLEGLQGGTGATEFWSSSVPSCPEDPSPAFAVLSPKTDWTGAQVIVAGQYLCARAQPGGSGGTVKWWSSRGNGSASASPVSHPAGTKRAPSK